jgi:uncharacterized protein Smg (DUF494 family)
MMKERIVELLVHLMSEMQVKIRLSERDLTKLQDKGFTQSEIGEALSWLHEKLGRDNGQISVPVRSPGGARRLFHEAEKAALSVDSQGYLIQLQELGLIDDRDLEAIIERAMFSGYEKLSVDEIREIIGAVLFGKPGNARRPLLNSRDSIH